MTEMFFVKRESNWNLHFFGCHPMTSTQERLQWFMASRIFELLFSSFPFTASARIYSPSCLSAEVTDADSPAEMFTSWRPLSDSNILTLTQSSRTIQTSHSVSLSVPYLCQQPNRRSFRRPDGLAAKHRRQKMCFRTNPMSKTGLSRSVWVQKGPTSAGHSLPVSKLWKYKLPGSCA